MSAHDSPPPASINIAFTNTVPRSWTGGALTRPRDPRRETPTQTKPIREPAQRMQPHVRDDLGVARLDQHPDRAVTVHLSRWAIRTSTNLVNDQG